MLDTTLKTRLTSGLLKSRCIIWAVQLVCHVNVRHCSCVHVLVIIISIPVHFIEFNYIFWNYVDLIMALASSLASSIPSLESMFGVG
jgi:hypothetical protein